MHLVFQELQSNLGPHDFDLGIEVDQITDQAGVVRFGVAHDQHVNRTGVDLPLQQRDPGVSELGVAGVDQSGAFSPNQKRVVGRAVAQAEFDVEAAAVPVQRPQGGGVSTDRFALQAQFGGGGGDDHGTDRDVWRL